MISEMVICNLWMYIRLLWYIVMEYHFLRISMLITFWKVYQTSKRRKHHTWASFCVHSLIQPIYTIQSKIECMLFKSLCLLSPYMHHFISSIIITVLCVSKITCPCFPISGFIKQNLQVQTITYYLPIENKNNTNIYWGIEKIIENIQNGCYIFGIIEKLALLYSVLFLLFKIYILRSSSFNFHFLKVRENQTFILYIYLDRRWRREKIKYKLTIIF